MGASKRAAKIDETQLVPTSEEDATNGKQKLGLQRQLAKTKFCMYHLKGICQYGSDCTFAHSRAELQSTPDLWKTRLCKAYAGGGCTDPKCSFAHGESELCSTDKFFKNTLCIWNEKGKCKDGDRCRFAHGISQLRTQAQIPHNANDKDARRCAPNLAQAKSNAVSVQKKMAVTTSDTSREPMKIIPSSSLAPNVEHQLSTPPGLMLAPPGLWPLPKGLDQIQPQAQDLADYHNLTSGPDLPSLLTTQLKGKDACYSQQYDQLEQSNTANTQVASMKSQDSDLFASLMLREMLLAFGKDTPCTIFDETVPLSEISWKCPYKNDPFGRLAPSQNYLTDVSERIFL